jgi:hypothetical protein
VTLTSSGVGFVLATRRPGNLIGLLLQANALTLSIVGAADRYATYAILAYPGALPGAEWAWWSRTAPGRCCSHGSRRSLRVPGWPAALAPLAPFAIAVGAAFAVLALTVLFESAPFTARSSRSRTRFRRCPTR